MKKIIVFLLFSCSLLLTHALNVPTLSSPTNGSTLSTISASLQWNSVSGASRYQWQCDTAQTFDSQLLVSGSTTSYYTTATGLHYGKTYYWRVRSCTAADTSEWSLTRTFSTPARVTLYTPYDGSQESSIGVRLEWNSMSGTSRYQWQCDTANTFDTPLLAEGSTTYYYTTATGLHYGKTYYWRVRSCTAADTSEWSLTRTFSTPARVTLYTPYDGSQESAIGVRLEWNSMSGTSRYQWQCDTANSFDTPLLAEGFTTYYYTTATGLHYGKTYYWRVRSCTAADTSEWSLTRTFSTPARVTLYTPYDGSQESSIGVRLEWNSMSGTSRYQWQCDTANSFDTPLLAEGSTTYYYTTATGLHYGKTYYWRVRSCTAADTSEWSLTRTFSTPARVTLYTPYDGSQESSIGVRLEWNSMSGTSRYQWQCDTANTFDTPLLAESSTTYYYTTATGLHYGKTYYWRVRSCTAADTSEWSLTRTFSTPARVTLYTPYDGSQESAIGVRLEWNSMSGTSRYQWQCDTANSFDTPLLAEGSTTYYYTTATGLHYGKTYYWRVRSCTAADTSQWSLVRTFSTPGGVTLYTPYDGAQQSAIGVRMEWNSMSGTSRYQWQCDTVNTFNSPLLSEGSTTYYYTTATNLHYGKTYYWRVRSCTAADTSQWSLVRTFITPARVTLYTPYDGTSLSSLSTSLQWNSISGSTRYIYQYDVTPDFNSTHLISSTTTSYYISVSGLNYNTTYYWRVCAYNAVDTSEWSLVRTFRTGTLNMVTVPTLVSPADGSTAIPSDGQTFTWDSYPNAQNYELEYSTSSTFSSDVELLVVNGTSTQFFGLEAHTTYYWRVRAANGVDFSPWSNSWSFTTANCYADLFDTENITICESELPYTFGDTTFGIGTTSGTYYLSQIVSGTCDTIHHITLSLTVNPVYNNDDYLVICTGQLPYTYGNTTFPQGTVSGDYPIAFTTINGCDSTVTLHLTVTTAINTAFAETACGTYTWNNETYNQSGIYTQNFTSSFGCDSIVTLNLTITSILHTNLTETACETFQWNGQTYTQSGTYTQTLTSANGCDSVVALNLTITHPINETINITSCGSYSWNNQLYTVSGTYQQTFSAANGCDSIVTMVLTINQSVSSQESMSICNSDLPYTWNGILFTQAGTRTITLTAANGCDSIVTMNLTVTQPVSTSENLTVCESDLPYTWNGIVFNEPGTETVTLSAANGCDSIVTLALSVTEINTDIDNCVMISGVGFAEMHVDQQDAQYQWINCSTLAPITNATSNAFTPTEAGNYACIITYNNCTDTTECIEATLQDGVNDIDAQNIRIYPNPTRDVLNVLFETGTNIKKAVIYDIFGQQIWANAAISGSFNVNVNGFANGTYLIYLETEDGLIVKRFIKE